jgi:hypothetical protein
MKKNKFKLSELLTQFNKTAAEEGGDLYAQAANTVAQQAGAVAAPQAQPQQVPVAEVPVDDSVGEKAVEALKEIAMEASALEQGAIQKEASEFGRIFAQSFMEEMGMQKMATEDVLMQAMKESYQATMDLIKSAEDEDDKDDDVDDDEDDDDSEKEE